MQRLINDQKAAILRKIRLESWTNQTLRAGNATAPRINTLARARGVFLCNGKRARARVQAEWKWKKADARMYVCMHVPILQEPRAFCIAGLSTIASEELQNHELQEFTSGCYFSAEYQGEFVMQVSSGNSVGSPGAPLDDGEPVVQYSTLNITFNAIPVWGYCHRKIDDKVLLMDRWGMICLIMCKVR